MMKRVSVVAALLAGLTSFGISQRSDLSGLKFCIDPGHGGKNSNDRHMVPDAGVDFYESESNFYKALYLRALLQAKGATVILTRESNEGTTYAENTSDPDEPSLAARVALANSNNVDWFHSIHSNAIGNGFQTTTSVNYTLILVREQRSLTDPAASSGNGMGVAELPQSWTLANIIGPSIKNKNRTSKSMSYLDWTFYGGTNGGFSLGVLRGLHMPGELSEGSFHDYRPETRRLMNSMYKKMEAYALRDAFLQYYGIPADTLCIVAGIQTDPFSNAPLNNGQVRILPEDRVYAGDTYNDGYFFFDSLQAGAHTVYFETQGYNLDSVTVILAPGETRFVDRAIFTGVPIGSNEIESSIPRFTNLAQNFPNPFNPSTVIEYQVAHTSHVRLSIFNILGQRVRTIVDEVKGPGFYSTTFYSDNLPTGVYLCQFEAGGFKESKKMILLR